MTSTTQTKVAVASMLTIFLIGGLVNSGRKREQHGRIDAGERLFSGCPEGIDRKETAAQGVFVCKGERDPEPFGGNGRACGSCHVPGDRFGMSVKRIPTLPADDPFFFAGIDEDQTLLRQHGLIHVVDRDEDSLNEFRPTPKLVHLRRLCDGRGECVALGLLGDRETDLCTFSREAVVNHLTKTLEHREGVDFRLPTDEECRALIEFMRSPRVADEAGQ